jgi:hypothetical protein
MNCFLGISPPKIEIYRTIGVLETGSWDNRNIMGMHSQHFPRIGVDWGDHGI